MLTLQDSALSPAAKYLNLGFVESILARHLHPRIVGHVPARRRRNFSWLQLYLKMLHAYIPEQ
ncbi:MAG: hypothetical protein RL332_714, partial [Actinomycetota bacterium]